MAEHIVYESREDYEKRGNDQTMAVFIFLIIGIVLIMFGFSSFSNGNMGLGLGSLGIGGFILWLIFKAIKKDLRKKK